MYYAGYGANNPCQNKVPSLDISQELQDEISADHIAQLLK